MKIVIAPDKFKGSLTGHEFCDATEEGLRMVLPNAEIIKLPLADGGDGTIQVIKEYLKAKSVKLTISDPFFRPREASYLFSKATKTAFIEMAEASGLKLLKEDERNCMSATSLGTGELIVDALAKGAKELILGIGGSATNDGGMGMAHALGFRFLDSDDNILQPIGSNLMYIKKIDASNVNPKLNNVIVKVSCDVTNPLYGKNGAAQVYAEQKGANKAQIEVLDQGLRNYAKVLFEQYSINVQKIEGAGAAGGLGAGALIFLNGRLIRGIDLIKDIANFDDAIKDADWIITGEGKLDDQTIAGKTIAGVIKSANEKGIPVAALCGTVALSEKAKKQLGLTYFTAVSKGITDMDIAIKYAYKNVMRAASEFASLVLDNELQFLY
ncbi:glycerate kinase [Maribacter sp. 2210JD10-5]|uniref:glycerate kinase n=1 Tax=Maribacter sp. 2210JD10-5 TaxID=3386272 RepID=UPI0039BD353B